MEHKMATKEINKTTFLGLSWSPSPHGWENSQVLRVFWKSSRVRASLNLNGTVLYLNWELKSEVLLSSECQNKSNFITPISLHDIFMWNFLGLCFN